MCGGESLKNGEKKRRDNTKYFKRFDLLALAQDCIFSWIVSDLLSATSCLHRKWAVVEMRGVSEFMCPLTHCQ